MKAKEIESTFTENQNAKQKTLRTSPYMLRNRPKSSAQSSPQWKLAPYLGLKDLTICIQRVTPVQQIGTSVMIFHTADGTAVPVRNPHRFPIRNPHPGLDAHPDLNPNPNPPAISTRKKFNPTPEELAKWEDEKRKNDQYFVIPQIPKPLGAGKKSRKQSPTESSAKNPSTSPAKSSAKQPPTPVPSTESSSLPESSSTGRFRVVVKEFECKCGKAFVTEHDLK